jgi:hypothetical protein
MNWYDYPVCVPFGNPNYDTLYGGSHDMDVRTPPNTMITALVDGTITDISAPTWGKQVCLQISGFRAPYMAYLHLAAVNPALHVGFAVKMGDIIGWSGGCTEESQYAGSSNPTGENFLNDPGQSSQPQTGIALMYGPVYGVGAGWKPFPPIDGNLNPLPLIQYARAHENGTADTAHRQAAMLNQQWQLLIPGLRYPTGIYQDWYAQALKGVFYGPPISEELQGETWEGQTCIRQYFLGGYCEDIGGVHHWYRFA